MIDIDMLLEHIHKTNPNMTKDGLLLKLNDNTSSAVALFIVCENSKK